MQLLAYTTHGNRLRSTVILVMQGSVPWEPDTFKMFSVPGAGR